MIYFSLALHTISNLVVKKDVFSCQDVVMMLIWPHFDVNTMFCKVRTTLIK